MTAIRQLEIEHFRGIASATWAPSPGVNALIGPGDSGKSTVLDAIDLALLARRNVQITDADFYGLDVSGPIRVTVTLGALPDALKDLDTYGPYLRGWSAEWLQVEPEPGQGLEDVLSLRLEVSSDLDPRWFLWSERAEGDGLARDLTFEMRRRLAPTRLGAFAAHHFSWGPKSVLNRLSDERAIAHEALA